MRRQLGEIVTVTREYIEEQMQLGFFDIEENTEKSLEQKDPFLVSQLTEKFTLYADLDLEALKTQAAH